MRTLLFVHLVTMAFWLGGQLFLVAVALPALRGQQPEARQQLLRQIGRWFGMVSVPTLLILIGTGVAMMLKTDMDPGELPALRHKLEALGVVLLGTVVHAYAGASGRTRLSRVSSVVTLIATLAVVWLALGI